VRALVISDTHFGAWTGRDLLREEFFLEPLADVRSSRVGRTRCWNSGCWIYEPDLGSRQAYARYLRYAWPGTAVLIDQDEPQPQLLELLADLNPLNGGPGLPSP
jgi:hypothetical protein